MTRYYSQVRTGARGYTHRTGAAQPPTTAATTEDNATDLQGNSAGRTRQAQRDRRPSPPGNHQRLVYARGSREASARHRLRTQRRDQLLAWRRDRNPAIQTTT